MTAFRLFKYKTFHAWGESRLQRFIIFNDFTSEYLESSREIIKNKIKELDQEFSWSDKYRGCEVKEIKKFRDEDIEFLDNRVVYLTEEIQDISRQKEVLLRYLKEDTAAYDFRSKIAWEQFHEDKKIGGKIMDVKRCIHGRTENQACFKCFRCVICGKPLNKTSNDYTVDYESDVAHLTCVKEKSTAQGLDAMKKMHIVRIQEMK